MIGSSKLGWLMKAYRGDFVKLKIKACRDRVRMANALVCLALPVALLDKVSSHLITTRHLQVVTVISSTLQAKRLRAGFLISVT